MIHLFHIKIKEKFTAGGGERKMQKHNFSLQFKPSKAEKRRIIWNMLLKQKSLQNGMEAKLP